MVKQHRFCTQSVRSVCWIVLASCFSPSPEEKRLVSYDDSVAGPGSIADAASTVRGGGPDGGGSAAPGEGGLVPLGPVSDAAPGSSAAPPDAMVGIVPADASAEGGPPMGFLFPSNCMAPWEETTKYHPAGYDAAKVHGLESNLNKDNCISCHGAKLEGCANSPSCDNCHDGGHPKDWRKKCVYCHGGVGGDELGAPPRDIDGDSNEATLSFRLHKIHTTKERHKAYDCDTCHAKYEDALDPGHMYDDTPEKAEVKFDGGISKDGRYLDNGRCGNLYCHGDAKKPKDVIDQDAGAMECTGCHADLPQTGAHATHWLGFDCAECHGNTIDVQVKISGPDYHVNGKVDLTMPDNNMQWNGKTCTGTCHIIVYHAGDTW